VKVVSKWLWIVAGNVFVHANVLSGTVAIVVLGNLGVMSALLIVGTAPSAAQMDFLPTGQFDRLPSIDRNASASATCRHPHVTATVPIRALCFTPQKTPLVVGTVKVLTQLRSVLGPAAAQQERHKQDYSDHLSVVFQTME